MGGLIQENTSDGRSGIPVLHELPVVGNLFGSTNNSMRRTELLVIITPRVVRTDVDIREVSEDLREHMRSLSPDRKSTRLNSSHSQISYAVFCLKKKKKAQTSLQHRSI